MYPITSDAKGKTMKSALNRRGFLLAAGAVAGTAALGACSSTPGAGPSSAPVAGAGALPNHVPIDIPSPDFPAPSDSTAIIFPGYSTYPANPVRVYSEPPLSGGTIRAMGYTQDALAPAMSQNSVWQGVNQKMGATFEIDYVPSADYQTKFATAIAGGDLPDIVQVRPPQQQLPAMLRSTFRPLTEFLQGDSITKYPSLANLPTYAWQEVFYEGDMWGVPIPMTSIASTLFTRKDLLDERGLSDRPADLEELKATFDALTDDRAGHWACGGDVGGFFSLILGMHGIPSGWTDDGGDLKYFVEHPGYLDALEDMRSLIEAGYFHPDAVSAPNTTRNDWFTTGEVASVWAGFTGWFKFVQWGQATEGFEMTGLIPGGRDGGGIVYPVSSSNINGFAAINNNVDDSRIEEVLGALDYLTAPFGTMEYLERFYGIEGETFEFDGTDPVVNSRGSSEVLVPFQYLVRAPGVVYFPNEGDQLPAAMQFQEDATARLPENPILGLYSETAAARQAQINSDIAAAQLDIFYGRQDVQAGERIRDSWASGGGEVMRDEYLTSREEA